MGELQHQVSLILVMLRVCAQSNMKAYSPGEPGPRVMLEKQQSGQFCLVFMVVFHLPKRDILCTGFFVGSDVYLTGEFIPLQGSNTV